MRRQHPDHRMDIPISMQVHHQLLGASINTSFEKEDWEIAAEAIDEWVRRHDPDALSTPVHSGYQWKRLFLPEGTVLRTVFDGKNTHCVVEGGKIAFHGKDVSPSGFVNAVGGMRRNAWLCTWILFPDTKQWQLADALRARRPRTPRAQQRPTQPAPVTPHAPASAPVTPTAVGSAPASVAPASPSPATPIPVAANLTETSGAQQTTSSPAPQSTCRGEAREPQPRTGIFLSPPRCARGADRRSNTHVQMAVLLRRELLPLLYRMCAGDPMPPFSA